MPNKINLLNAISAESIYVDPTDHTTHQPAPLYIHVTRQAANQGDADSRSIHYITQRASPYRLKPSRTPPSCIHCNAFKACATFPLLHCENPAGMGRQELLDEMAACRTQSAERSSVVSKMCGYLNER